MSYLRSAVRIRAPDQHFAEIELRFPVDAPAVDVTLPAWCPGSYLVRDYARFVRDLEVLGDDGARRTATKRDKPTWSKVLDDWTRLIATPGRKRQSLEASSFDAWIKLYKPDESNLDTTVSHYLKGGLTMLALDLQIRRRTEGARSFDDVLRLLWQRYGEPGEPHPDELQSVFEEATGLALAEVFARQIRGTEDPELVEELRHVGLELRASADPAQIADGASAVWLGATVGGGKVTGVLDGSPACTAGLSPGDEIIAIDGFRVTGETDVRNLTGAQRPGDELELAVFRRARLVRLRLRLAAAPATRYEITAVPDPGPAAARYHAWIGEPHPGAQVLATVTTTARWV